MVEHSHIIILDEVGVVFLNACKLTSKALAKEIVGLPVQANVIRIQGPAVQSPISANAAGLTP